MRFKEDMGIVRIGFFGLLDLCLGTQTGLVTLRSPSLDPSVSLLLLFRGLGFNGISKFWLLLVASVATTLSSCILLLLLFVEE